MSEVRFKLKINLYLLVTKVPAFPVLYYTSDVFIFSFLPLGHIETNTPQGTPTLLPTHTYPACQLSLYCSTPVLVHIRWVLCFFTMTVRLMLRD